MNQKFLTLTFLITLILAGGVWVWEQQTKEATQNTPSQQADQIQTSDEIESVKDLVDGEYTFTPVDTSDWQMYRNEEIGIQFYYPRSWGEIIPSKEAGCVDYYAEEVTPPQNIKESCFHITLRASNFQRGAFLSTEGIDYTKTDIPRGADWRYRLLPLTKEQEDFCLNNPFLSNEGKGGQLGNCESFKNETGLTITKGIRDIPFVENETMNVYFIRINHPVYYDLVLSSYYLASDIADQELQKLIASIRY